MKLWEDNMDPELQRKIEEARANGYTDEEIQTYLANSEKPQQVQPQVPIDRTQEYKGLAQGIGLEAATNFLDVGAKAAAVGAGAYGAKKAYDYLAGQRQAQAAQQAAQQVAQQVPQQMAARATGTGGQGAFNQMASQLGDNRIRFPGGQPVAPTAPTAPTAAPAPAAPTPQQQSMVQRGMEYATRVREIAMNKVMENAGKVGRAGVGIAAAVTPGNIGQNYPFPTSGPYKGMEINPITGRPWTPQELALYR